MGGGRTRGVGGPVLRLRQLRSCEYPRSVRGPLRTGGAFSSLTSSFFCMEPDPPVSARTAILSLP